MKQQTLSDMEYGCRKKKTKREEFLKIMDEIILRDEWVGASDRTIQQTGGGVHLSIWNKFYGCICCRFGSTCPPLEICKPQKYQIICSIYFGRTALNR